MSELLLSAREGRDPPPLPQSPGQTQRAERRTLPHPCRRSGRPQIAIRALARFCSRDTASLFARAWTSLKLAPPIPANLPTPTSASSPWVRVWASRLIAAIHGAAVGGGTGLAANCHIVVASENATFGLTEIRLGLWPFLVYRAVALGLGERRTVELALTGRTFRGREAVEIGIAHEVAVDCEARALAVAESLAAFSPTAIRSGLRFVQETRTRIGRRPAQSPSRFVVRCLRVRTFRRGFGHFARNARQAGLHFGEAAACPTSTTPQSSDFKIG